MRSLIEQSKRRRPSRPRSCAQGARLRILHVVAPGDAGGLESVVCTLAAGQQQRGHEVHCAVVTAALPERHAFVNRIELCGVIAHEIEIAGRAYLREQRTVGNLCRDLLPDVVHLHGYHAVVVNGPAARRSGWPTVVTVHGFTSKDWRSRSYEWLHRRECRRSDAVVAVSRPLAELLARRRVPRNRLHTIVNAWESRPAYPQKTEARRLLSLPDEGFRIGWVGRLSHEKGPDLMLDALALLKDLPVSLSIFGDGSLREPLLRQARRLQVEEKICWHGVVDNAAEFYRAFDVFVLSSRAEGTPMALLEAMAAETPIVATRVGGVPDVLSASAALLAPANEPQALAKGIRETFHNPTAAAERCRIARRRLLEDFAIAPWVTRYDEVYAGVRRTSL